MWQAASMTGPGHTVEAGTDRATIATLYERESIETDAGTVEVVPAWRWMLQA